MAASSRLSTSAGLGLPERDVDPDDRFIVARSAARTLVLTADQVDGLKETPAEEVVEPNAVFPGIGLLAGVMRLADGLLLIVDLDRFLAADEGLALDGAVHRQAERVSAGTRPAGASNCQPPAWSGSAPPSRRAWDCTFQGSAGRISAGASSAPAASSGSRTPASAANGCWRIGLIHARPKSWPLT